MAKSRYARGALMTIGTYQVLSLLRRQTGFLDSDIPVAENVELLSFPHPDEVSRSSNQYPRSVKWLKERLPVANFGSNRYQTAHRFLGYGVRLIRLIVIGPITLTTRLVQICFGLPNRRNIAQQACRLLGFACLASLIFLVLIGLLTAVFSPSFTNFPPHYLALRQLVESSSEPGRANPLDQRIFIAASLYDPHGQLLRGPWANSVLKLIDILGPQNTHLSIYVSDSGNSGLDALKDLSDRVHSPKTFQHSEQVPVDGAPVVVLPDGQPAVKRIEYLTRARNLALNPIETAGHFDKIFFLNDVFFDPVEAAQLMFLTNSQPYDPPSKERANYRAACATDFDNPFKYYDTLATRDWEGYSMGVPIFPFFSGSGSGESRKDMLRQVDAVRVKACWGGMVAFDARYFQRRLPFGMASDPLPKKNGKQAGLWEVPENVIRFRSEPELDWEYSECCLIHADLADAPPASQKEQTGSVERGIYMNPYIRTAYNEKTFKNLWVGRRLEKILVHVQSFLTTFTALPFYNERRSLGKGETVSKIVWVTSSDAEIIHGRFDNGTRHVTGSSIAQRAEIEKARSPSHGHWVRKNVAMSPGGFCAIRHLMVRRAHTKPGELTWETFHVPLEGEMAALNEVEVSDQ